MSTHTLPFETDTALAELNTRAYGLQDRVDSLEQTAKQQAGAKFYYRGRRRVTDMTVDEAETILAAELAKLEAHEAATQGQEGRWIGYSGIVAPHAERQVRSTLEKLEAARIEQVEVENAMMPLQATYAEHRWSRFFLVVSSAGHIHSSTCCSTCRPTTRYGWLPELSGKTEAEAVEAHGPALCSVCFPSAPVEWVVGKLTKSQAEKAAH